MARFYTYGEVPMAALEFGDDEGGPPRSARQAAQGRAAEESNINDLLEMERRQAAIDAARAEEAARARQAEEARQAEAARQEQLRQAEAARQTELARQAELARQEQERQAELARQEQLRQEQARQAEAARIAEEQRVAVEREAAQRAEAERVARQAELDRLAQVENARKAAEAEQARVAAEENSRKQAAATPTSPIEEAGDFIVPKTPEQAKAMQDAYALLNESSASRMEPIGALNFALDFGGGAGGGMPTVIEKSLYSPEETEAEKAMREEIAKSYVAPTKSPEASTADVAAMSGLSEEDLSAAQEQISKPYAERNAILSQIGDRLKANDFKGAFDIAMKAEQEGKGMFFENIIDPDKMRYLRGPMTADEMRKFYAELPQEEYLKRYGDRSDFISERALERNLAELGGKAGFADPRAGLKAKESVITDAIKFATEYGLDAIMAASGIPPTAAALTKAAQVYAETNGNMDAVLKAAAATYAGTTIGQKVGDLIPSSGAVSKAAESAVEKAATQGVAAGLTGDALAEVVVRAAAEQGLGSAVTGTLVSKAIDNALRNQAEAGLEQIEVSTFKPSLEKALASTVTTGGVQDILSERDILEQQEAEAKDQENKDDLETITVTGSPVKPVINPIDLTKKGGLDELEKTLSEQTGAEKPGFEDKPVEDQTTPEVVVTAKKTPPLDVGDVAAGLGGAAVLTQGYTDPNVDPTTGEQKETAKTEQELDKIEEKLKTGAPVAPTPFDQLKDLLTKYKDVEQLLKILGSLGALGGGKKTTPVKGPAVEKKSDSLPVYNYRRTALNPDIDYTRYGFGPEATFFSYGPQAGEPAGTKPPKENDVYAKGGLTAYEDGGSTEQRYFDGPGSGRDDLIPALLSDGEYVMDAETLALLGDGSTKEGARKMDQFRANIRKHKGRALSRGRISPNAKSPDKYMGGGLT